jgi:hypothetical protein
MKAETTKLTIRLPRENVETAKSFAARHGISVTEVIDRYLKSLNRMEESLSPEVTKITGLVPEQVDAKTEYRKHLTEKHGR